MLLTWDDNSTHEDKFRIERATLGGDFVAVGEVGADVTRYWDRTTEPLVRYRYRVLAVAGETLSSPSNVMEKTVRGRVANLSMRGFVGRDDALMIGGTFIRDNPVRLLVRAIGPTLAQFNVPGALAAPAVTVFDANGATLASGGPWGGDPLLAAVMAQCGAFPLPTDSADAALIIELPPGGYSIHVRGANGTEGIALVEIYELESR